MSSKVTVQCAQCNNSITKFPSLIGNRKYGNFCNKDCLGLFRTAKLTGSLAANFKTGGIEERNYFLVQAPWHPRKTKDNYIYLHRLIVEAKLGRFLEDNEIVHHIDGNHENNHWDNLQVMTQAEHAKEHILDGTIKRNPITNRYERGNQ